jgi:hypothetical protein
VLSWTHRRPFSYAFPVGVHRDTSQAAPTDPGLRNTSPRTGVGCSGTRRPSPRRRPRRRRQRPACLCSVPRRRSGTRRILRLRTERHGPVRSRHGT